MGRSIGGGKLAGWETQDCRMEFTTAHAVLKRANSPNFFTEAIASSIDQTSTPALWMAPATNRFKPACAAKLRRRFLAQMTAAANDRKFFAAPHPLAEDADFSSGSIIHHGPIQPCQQKITGTRSLQVFGKHRTGITGFSTLETFMRHKHSIASARKRAARLLNRSRSACENSGSAR